MNVKHLYGLVDEAIRTKHFIGGLGRLKKNGSIVRINGQIFERKTTKSGEEMILIDNFLGKARKNSKKKWQIVLLQNLVALNQNNWECTKKSA